MSRTNELQQFSIAIEPKNGQLVYREIFTKDGKFCEYIRAYRIIKELEALLDQQKFAQDDDDVWKRMGQNLLVSTAGRKLERDAAGSVTCTGTSENHSGELPVWKIDHRYTWAMRVIGMLAPDWLTLRTNEHK